MRNLLINIFIVLSGQEGATMMAMLWASEIMLKETLEEAKEMYKRCPRLLKDKVKEIIINAGMGEIVEE